MYPKWERAKATEIIVYVIERVRPRWGHTQPRAVLEIIYQADKLHLERHGRTITRDDYVATRLGMYPIYTNDLLYADDSDAFQFGEGGVLVAHRPADLMQFSRSDNECLDATLERYHRVSHHTWRGGVMDWAWHVATDGGAQFRGDDRSKTIPVSLLGVTLGLPNAVDILKDMFANGLEPCGKPSEPMTLGEALERIGSWGEIIGGCIERGEVIPPEVFLVSFRELTAAERKYGRQLAATYFDKDGRFLGQAAATPKLPELKWNDSGEEEE